MATNTGLDNKRVGLNIIFNCVAYLVNAFISLFITPYITSNLGAEAYGFVKLANDFAAYGSLITLALNSMASRFIMLSREQGNDSEARAYYSSITIANIVLASILAVPMIMLALGVNVLFDVPENMLVEVRWTFIWTLSNFLICLAGTTFGNCFFLKNRLDISSVLTSITSIIRAIFIIIAFVIVGPKISIMAFGSIIVTAIFMPCNIIFHKILTPDLYFDYQAFEWKKVKQVLFSGIWNSITRLSQILKTGLDLTISNLLLGALNMGYLSVAKTIPNFISSLINAVGNSFTPNMMQLYAREERENLKRAIKSSMKVMSIFSTVTTSILLVFGTVFYSLWVPEQPTKLINTLSIMTIIGICVLGPMQPLYQVFTLTNKIKQSSLVFIIEGIVSIVVTVFCVKTLEAGLYAVAGISAILSVVTALVYHLPMSARYIGLPWYTFFPEIGKTIIVFLIQCLVGGAIRDLLPISQTWESLIIGAGIQGALGVIITLMIILDKNGRDELFTKVKRKICRY